MNVYSTEVNPLAIAGGVLAGVAAVYAITNGEWLGNWGMSQILTVACVVLAILFGHLAKSEWSNGRLVGGTAAGAIFLIATSLVLINSAGRQAEQAKLQYSKAEASNEMLESKKQDLAREKARLEKATAMTAWEIQGRPNKYGKATGQTGCGSACKGWQADADDARKVITTLEADIAATGAPKPVHTKATQIGEAVAWFGGDSQKAESGVRLFEPYLMALLFEIGAIAGFSLGIPATRKPEMAFKETDETKQSDYSPVDVTDTDPPRGPRIVYSKDMAEFDVRRLVKSGTPISSQDTLAGKWNVSKGCVSKWLSDFESRGLIERPRDGRCKTVVRRRVRRLATA